MNKLIDKIAFLVHEPTLYDHWVGVWRLLDRTGFEIVLLDSFRDKTNGHFRKNTDEFIAKISEAKYKHTFSGDLLYKKLKYRYIISNHIVAGSSLNNPELPLEGKLRNQIKIFLNFILNSFKIKKIYTLSTPEQYLPMRIGDKQIRFMYGADISEGWTLGKWNEMYDFFLCHGPNDEQALNRRFRGKTIQIGYPRYDDYFNVPGLGEDLKKVFSCAPEKKTVVWLPTVGEGTCSIPHYVKQISELSKKYNVIVRPHPITFRKAPENIRLLVDLHFKIDDDSLRDMNALYKIADFVICDYGGTSFSAVYLDKNIILLNTPGASEWYTSKNSSDLELRKELSPVLTIQEAGNLIDILQNESIWTKQAEQRRNIFPKYFASYRGNSAKRVASILSDLIAGNAASNPKE